MPQVKEKGNRVYALRSIATDNEYFYAYGTWKRQVTWAALWAHQQNKAHVTDTIVTQHGLPLTGVMMAVINAV